MTAPAYQVCTLVRGMVEAARATAPADGPPVDVDGPPRVVDEEAVFAALVDAEQRFGKVG